MRHVRISALWKWYGTTAFGHRLEEYLTACLLVVLRLADDLDLDDEFAEEKSPSSSRLRNCWSSRSVINQR